MYMIVTPFGVPMYVYYNIPQNLIVRIPPL